MAINLVLAHRLGSDIDTLLRTRAAAAVATAAVDGNGHMTIKEGSDDEALDSGVWFYSGERAVERPPGSGDAQASADALAGHGPEYADGDGIRLYAIPIVSGGSRVGTVVTSLSTAPYRRTREEALIGSVVLAALTLIGAYLALHLAATRALRPVDAMTLQASEWSASALTERFGPDQRFEELQVLAETLNGVLDRLTASVRHEQRLFAELSHELRSPLSLIVAETDLLLAREHDAEQVCAAHLQVRETAMAMNRILETLLSAGRAEVAKAAGSCRIDAVVETLLEHRSKRTPDRPDRTYSVDVPAGLVAGAEAAIVERVLGPLIDNAGRFARNTVAIAGRRTSDSVLIEVCDDGPGVPAGNGETIFEPGVQLASNRENRGAGLGLPLARRLARAAAGDVVFVGGSTFQVRLPPA
ncbi:MAG TPA: HAMP domain-containing sensor histidine kinase [Mycobacteriales bacterium]|nr:HAMP domain-containing sensor histidine kinase [Mycobacteriales bacterium]